MDRESLSPSHTGLVPVALRPRPLRPAHVLLIQADPLPVLGIQVESELREEEVRVDHRQPESLVFGGVQPQKPGARIAVYQGVMATAEPDQAERELDYILRQNLDRAEADALECDC